jgi:hypothetical protein
VRALTNLVLVTTLPASLTAIRGIPLCLGLAFKFQECLKERGHKPGRRDYPAKLIMTVASRLAKAGVM